MELVSTSNIHATLLPGQLSVIQIPPAHIRSCTWPLLNLLLYGECGFRCREDDDSNPPAEHICRLQQSELFSMVVDNDGITLFLDPNGISMFEAANMQDKIVIAPQKWRAIQIHLGPMVAEFPGVVRFLSKLLAEDNISILNMSTYDTDIIYVQECNLESAVDCLQRKLSRGVHGLKEYKDQELQLSSEPNDLSCIVGSGQYLAVYSACMVLVRLKKEALRDCAFGLTQLVLKSQSATKLTDSFWCYCETAEEISLILDEECLTDFAEDAVIVSPDRWRVIKLCGKTYDFDETGIVAAMSGLNSANTQVLNVSSFGSNVTLVLEDVLEESVASLCSILNVSRVERIE
ncbi:GATS protein-like 3 [Aphanomyces cochlioides]|nr:GATS protein-like 3 [Aphanomyces cochlioides]